MINLRSLFISSVLTITSLSVMAADLISMKQIYNYASKQDISALRNIKNQLETLDSKGNTAVCQAILNEDVKTYNALIRAGANANATCIKNIPQATYNNFMTSVAQSGMAGGDVVAGTAVGTTAGTTAATSTGTFLGMGAVGWGITGAVVAGGVAAAAGGGGGGGGGSGGAAPASDPCSGITCGTNASCSAGSCICNSGYTGTDCSPVDCGYTTTSCGAGYEATGETCQSGETVYTECQPINCIAQGYSANCGAGYDATQSCLSGTTPYYTCTAKPVPSGYQAESCGIGYDETATFLSGETTYHLCTAKDVPTGYTTSPCSGGYEQDGATFISGETNYYKCKAKDVPAGYQAEACGAGYNQTGTFLSGETTYHKCEAKICGAGYVVGTTCSGEGYHQDGELCLSGTTNYIKCVPNDCTGYQTSCGTGYNATQSCISGTTPYYTCVPKTCPIGYNTLGTFCEQGYVQEGEVCISGEQPYVKCLVNECPATHNVLGSCSVGYEQVGEPCYSAESTYVQCTEKAVPPGYSVMPCVEGYVQEGDVFISGTTNYYKCIERDCSDYQISCGEGYNSTQSCQSGTTLYYTCTPKTVPDGYTITPCSEGYVQINSMQSGENTYYQCELDENHILGEDGNVYEKLTCQTNERQKNNQCICIDGYGHNSTGQCVLKESDKVGKTITNNSFANVIGLNEPTTSTFGVYSSETSTRITTGFYNNGKIKLVNNGDGDVFGTYNNTTNYTNSYNAYAPTYSRFAFTSLSDATTNSISSSASINIQNTGDGNVYGMVDSRNNSSVLNACSIAITGSYNGNGRYPESVSGSAGSRITITNVGNGDVYGIKGNTAGNASAYGSSPNFQTKAYSSSTGNIKISNFGSGTVYGLYGKVNAYNTNASMGTTDNQYATTSVYADGNIDIFNAGYGKTYGIYSEQEAHNAQYSVSSKSSIGNIIIKNNTLGTAYGISGTNIDNFSSGPAKSYITLVNIGDGLAVGMYAVSTTNNSGDITIHNLTTGTAVGMLIDENGTATNSGTITIDRESYTDDMGTPSDSSDDVIYTASSAQGGRAIGIYGASGSTIKNTGKIIIDGASESYGVYAESGATVKNTGTIKIDGNSNHTNAIKLNGGKLFQNGVLIASNTNSTPTSLMSVASVPQTITTQHVDTTPKASLNLNDFGGTVVASNTSQFVVEGALSGDLEINNDVITDGFKTTYTVSDMIQAGDSSGLNLKSQSALFDASLADNGHDVVMKMKSFDTVTDNSSFAQFLATNYALGQDEAFFSTLKQIGNMSELTGSLDKMMGKEMLSRFAFEDMTMMRELNFDMNNHLFNNKESYFSMGGSVSSPMAFKGDNGSNSRYSLSSKSDGVWSIGLGVAFTDIRSDDDHDNNSRSDTMYQMIVPIGYKTAGFHFMTSPRLGYARGSYDRIGFNDKSYDGTIEKRIFGLMNEARYPINVGDWKFEPAVEFNALGYEQKGWEDKKEFSLNIPTQRTYSVESGIGLYATHEKELNKDSKFKLTAGVAAYHEFADPYKMDVGMSGLSGHFTLGDENRSDNRAVARTGFEFNKGDYSLTGSFISYIDRETRTKANLGFKWKF